MENIIKNDTRRSVLKKGVALAGVAATPFFINGKASAAKTKLVVQVAKNNISKMEAIKSSFVSKFPDVDLQFIPLTGMDHEDRISKTLAQIAAGQQIDLYYVATEGVQLFAGAGYIQPFDKWIKRDADQMKGYFSDVASTFINSMMYEGSVYMLPYGFNAANVYVNTKLFRDNGIDYPEYDWTKDDFYNIAKKITRKTGNRTDVFGYGWTNRLWGSWMPWIFNNDGNLYSESSAPNSDFSSWFWNHFYNNDVGAKAYGGGPRWEEPTANTDNVIEALEFMKQMQDEGITPALQLGGGETLTGFYASNRMAMTPAGGFWAGGLNSQGMSSDDFDVCFFPKWKSQRHQYGAGGHIMLEKCKNKDLAWEWIKHTTSYEFASQRMMGNFTTPIRRSMMNALRYSYTGPKHWEIFYDTLDRFPTSAPIPAPPCANPMTRAFTKQTSLAMEGSVTPKKAMDKLQKDLVRITRKFSPMYKS